MRIHDNSIFEPLYSDFEQSLHLIEELEGSIDALHRVTAQCSPPVTIPPDGTLAARQS